MKIEILGIIPHKRSCCDQEHYAILANCRYNGQNAPMQANIGGNIWEVLAILAGAVQEALMMEVQTAALQDAAKQEAYRWN